MCAAFMIVAGIILFLPGLCAVISGGMGMSASDPMLNALIVMGVLCGILGILLIWNAIRGRT